MTGEDAAVREWAPVAEAVARGFFFPGADREDVDQEALIGLWKGLRDFNGTGVKGAFLGMAVRRHLIEKTRQARREKHRPLTEAVRHATNEDGDTVPAVDLLPAQRSLEGFAPNLLSMIDHLPLFERRACIGVAIGMEYRELGAPKAIDNALQRARRKLRGAA